MFTAGYARKEAQAQADMRLVSKKPTIFDPLNAILKGSDNKKLGCRNPTFHLLTQNIFGMAQFYTVRKC